MSDGTPYQRLSAAGQALRGTEMFEALAEALPELGEQIIEQNLAVLGQELATVFNGRNDAMTDFNRRHFLFASTGAAAGTLLVPGIAEGEGRAADTAESGLLTGRPKPLRHTELPGFLSAAQIAPHHTAHYGGALKAVIAADAQLEEAARSGVAGDPAVFAHLKRLVNSRGNSVVLHEFYFDGLSQQPVDPPERLRAAIEGRFGSLENWSMDFIASAKEAAGWTMLVKHPVNGKLYNVISDEHAMGVLWMAQPLIVIDTYEHAFYVDYQNRKAEYVENFMSHIDWLEAGRRFGAE